MSASSTPTFPPNESQTQQRNGGQRQLVTAAPERASSAEQQQEAQAVVQGPTAGTPRGGGSAGAPAGPPHAHVGRVRRLPGQQDALRCGPSGVCQMSQERARVRVSGQGPVIHVSSRPKPGSGTDTHVPFRFEVWGTKILSAIESQGRLLSDIAQTTREGVFHHHQQQQQQQQQHSPRPSHSSVLEQDDPETMSRKDVPWTPITGSDKILDWAVFPADKPVRTLPASVYRVKPNPYAFGMYIATTSI